MKVIYSVAISLCVFFDGSLIAQNAKESPDASTGIVVGKNVAIKSRFDGLPVVEPHITAHPANSDHLLVAAQVVTDIERGYESCRLSSFVSTDGGKTWKETAHDWWGYDPWVSILADGQTAMTWIGSAGRFRHQFPLRFFKSDDGGITWDKNVQMEAGNYDGTKVVGLGEEFYFTSVRFNQRHGADVILYHRAGGGDFEEVAKIDGKGMRLNFCEPAILTDGTVVVPASEFLKKSWVQNFDPATKTLAPRSEITSNPGGGRGYMRMVADTGAESRFKDRIYFVRATGQGRFAEGLFLNYSSDQGKTWSKEIRVDRFDNDLKSKAVVACVAVNKDGAVGVSWVDSQHDPAQMKNDVYFAVSTDGGNHFSKPVKVTEVSSNPRSDENGDVVNKYFGGGHYMGITARADGSFQLVWSDSRGGHFQVQTANVRLTKGKKE